MLDINSLIGKNVKVACKILQENGYKEIEIKENFTPDERCNERLVCAAKLEGRKVLLIIGEFITHI